MRWTFITILFILLTLSSADACICGLESIHQVRQRSIEQSELIFTAKVILEDTTKNFFRLKVMKIYKGTIAREIDASGFVDPSGGWLTCTFWPSPHWGNKFIIYANRIKGTMLIFIDDCSATRSIKNPNVHLAYPPNTLVDRKQRRQARRDLKEEIEILKKLNVVSKLAG